MITHVSEEYVFSQTPVRTVSRRVESNSSKARGTPAKRTSDCITCLYVCVCVYMYVYVCRCMYVCMCVVVICGCRYDQQAIVQLGGQQVPCER